MDFLTPQNATKLDHAKSKETVAFDRIVFWKERNHDSNPFQESTALSLQLMYHSNPELLVENLGKLLMFDISQGKRHFPRLVQHEKHMTVGMYNTICSCAAGVRSTL